MAAIEFEKQGHIGVITLNRPEVRNAINGDVANGMEAAIDEIEEDPDLWASILTANGPSFCAGADLKNHIAGGSSTHTERGGFAGLVRRQRSKPMIAAITGSAVAGGSEIALACDMIVCSDETVFGLPEVKRSLLAGAGGLFRLPRALGMATALEAILTGDPLPAERAYQLGMVNKVVPAGEVMDEARALAERIMVNAPLAVQASLRVARRALTEDDDELFSAGFKELDSIRETEDFKEGPKAFVEKRPPVWKGR